MSLFSASIVIALCRRKSTRLVAVIGGLVIALGVLFASFATLVHQVALSYCKYLFPAHGAVLQLQWDFCFHLKCQNQFSAHSIVHEAPLKGSKFSAMKFNDFINSSSRSRQLFRISPRTLMISTRVKTFNGSKNRKTLQWTSKEATSRKAPSWKRVFFATRK